MSSELRRKKILEKQVIQRQKNYINEINKYCHEDISSYLSTCECVINPELKELEYEVRRHSKVLSNYTDSFQFVGSDTLNYYREYSWERSINIVLNKFLNIIDNEWLYLWYIGRSSPAYKITKKWLLTVIDLLWIRKSKGYNFAVDFCLFTEKFDTGFIVNRYGGYLMNDPNPREILYGIEVWGSQINAAVNSIT